jgi:cysteinyl-tRNA synthetase
MSLRLYNTLTRRKEVFEPIDPANVRVYACGPTVYDHVHIGNGRMLIVFDLLFRLLRHVYGPDCVKYVRNITDVDDKINARAAERGVDIRVLTDEMIGIFHDDAAALGCLPPTIEPRATDHIVEMIAIIERLVARGNAYVADAHVLFDVPSMPDYGQLSKRPLDDMIAGARVEVAPYKRGPMDFVLWKPTSMIEPGWESPWGRGRPGWHIECSAMSFKHLGETFDIHGGGIDLVFPHHENEVAQTRCAFGHQVMANVWMHNGFLQVEGEKMSKSLGNFVTIHELLHSEKFGGRSWPGEVLRLAMLKTHHRQPIDFTVKALEEAERTLDRWRNRLQIEPQFSGEVGDPDERFAELLSDDLNTPAAITRVHELMNAGHWAESEMPAEEQVGSFAFDDPNSGFLSNSEVKVNKAKAVAALRLLGIDLLSKRKLAVSEAEVRSLVVARENARKWRNWAESDRIRDELDAMGVALKDNKDGTTSWGLKP